MSETKTPTPKQRPTSAEDIARQVVSTMDRHVSTSTIALWTDTDPRTFAAPLTLRVLPDDVEEAVALAIHSMSGTTPDTPPHPLRALAARYRAAGWYVTVNGERWTLFMMPAIQEDGHE